MDATAAEVTRAVLVALTWQNGLISVSLLAVFESVASRLSTLLCSWLPFWRSDFLPLRLLPQLVEELELAKMFI
eukprot:6189661-Pleurochrysis_carterae.AAC.4